MKTKEDYIKELRHLKRNYDKLVESSKKTEMDLEFCKKQHTELKTLAEKQGTEKHEWKTKALKLEEKLISIKTEIDFNKKGEK